LIRLGVKIKLVIFSICEDSIPEGFDKKALENESLAAADYMGIPRDQVEVYNFPVRRLDQHRQEILELMIKLRNANAFDTVILPNSQDIHQDHKVVHSEALRAFKMFTLLGYELPWNDLTSMNNMYVELSATDLERKIKAISIYETQKMIRSYVNRDFITSLAKVRGVQAKLKLAEAFELIRYVNKL
jgi:N-acetylglucosamine malate deacetylase 1